MTDHSERDEAARKYCGPNPHRAPTWPVRYKAFTAGADWAVKNDRRVLKLVEAIQMLLNPMQPSHKGPCGPDAGCDVICMHVGRDREFAQKILTEWSKP